MTATLDHHIDLEFPEDSDDPEETCEIGGSERGLVIFGFRIGFSRDRGCENPATWKTILPCNDTWLVCEKHHDDIATKGYSLTCDHGTEYSGHRLRFVPIGRP